jgi:WS/DGAT/MGAT family acyltransferase
VKQYGPDTPIDRATSLDVMHLALQSGAVPEQFGAVLILDPAEGFDVAAATSLLARRIGAVPRLRQRLVRTPPGCGRAVWVDDGDFAVDRHIHHLACPAPGDEHALLRVAADLLLQSLPLDRPLWAATFVSGLAGGRVAVTIVMQHALADGLGGLAVLGSLVDGPATPTPRTFPRPPPSSGRLAADAFVTRTRALIAVAGRVRAREGVLGSRGIRTGRAAPCSLLQPTGHRREVATVSVALGRLHAAAHRHSVTVNDTVITAIGGALNACLEQRGEHVPGFVIGIPVSQRRSATAAAPGNQISEVRVLIPGDGDRIARLRRVSEIMRIAKRTTQTTWMNFLAPAVARATIALGVYHWYLRRQRYLHTLVSNVRGPDRQFALAGAPMSRIIPLSIGGGGNVTVSFVALSYQQALTVSIIADPATTPDLEQMRSLLQAELDALIQMQ